MFRSKTVFILGAGASKEFGLPVGFELAGDITKRMDLTRNMAGGLEGGDRDLFYAVLEKLGSDEATCLAAARRIANGLPLRKSIDDFLDIWRNDPEIQLLGKSAIAKKYYASRAKINASS